MRSRQYSRTVAEYLTVHLHSLGGSSSLKRGVTFPKKNCDSVGLAQSETCERGEGVGGGNNLKSN